VLPILNPENHKKGYYGRAGVDDKLPGITETGEWAGKAPNFPSALVQNGFTA
jgi:hypothetical protein